MPSFADMGKKGNLLATPEIEHEINTTTEHTVSLKPYPVPNKLVFRTEEELKRLLYSKIIRKRKWMVKPYMS